MAQQSPTSSLIGQSVLSPQKVKAPPSLFDIAKQQYPVLQGMNLGYTFTPKQGTNMLEFWPAGESGTSSYPRPQQLPIGQSGIQVFDQATRPIDILGDVVSHDLVTSDQKIAEYYKNFQDSLSEQQKQNLKEQYNWSKKHEGETRSYDDWLKMSGMPAYFRGYAFKQWPESATSKMYTSSQIKMFDEMMKYLSSPRKEKK